MGLDDQKLKKKYNRKKIVFYSSKIAIYSFLGLQKDIQPTGEAFSPQKRTSSTSKNEIL